MRFLAAALLIGASLLAPALSALAQVPAGRPTAGPPAGPTPQRGAPLVIDPPLRDFGVVAPGSRHPTTFVLRNAGSAPLTIARAQPSCKCTDVTLIDGKTLAPGESVELGATLAVPDSPGLKDAKVMISVNGFPGVVVAAMQADVTFPVRVDPAYVDALKGVSSGVVTLRSVDGTPFRVLSAGGRPPRIQGFDAVTDSPRNEYRLEWSAADLGSPLPQWWVIDTDRADCPQLPLRIRHESTGSRFDPGRLTRFWFAPESIVLAGRVKAGGTATLRTSIEHLNPSAQGRVTNPEWSAVRGLRVPGGEGTAELVSAQPRGGDFVDIAFRFTPASGRSGPMYVPVEITTGSGSGLVYVAVTVEP